jgi:GlpG protein
VRQIGSIEDRQQAERFVAYLIGKRIPCSFDGGDSSWRIWIQEEDDVATAKTELDQFRADPNHERYQNAIAQAEIVLRQQLQQAKEISRRTVDLRERWQQPIANQCPITVGLLAIMTLVFLVQTFAAERFAQLLFLLPYSLDGTTNQIRAGEFWRVITPIFLHGGPLHFFFNAMALRDLGFLLESRIGSQKFLGIVLVVAVLSNALQFSMSPVPFGGMSGVNYGLFGYVWVRGRLDPDSGLWLPRSVITYMMVWFCVCFFIPRIANGAHTGGLVSGAVLGTISTSIRYLRRRL